MTVRKATKKTAIQVGIWGLGRAGWGMHCPELDRFKDEFEVVAGCDIDPNRVDELLARYPKAKGYTDGSKFLSDKNIELVSVAVRSPQHADYAIRALEAGKMVFLEKPIAISPKGLKALEAAVAKYPGKLFFRQNRRFESCFNHVQELIHSGILGDVYEIKLCRHGFEFRDDWQTLMECGGGQLNNWGPHIIDHGLRLLDAPLKSVWGDLKTVAALGDAEDHLKIILKGENGRLVDIEISGGVALPSPVYAVYGSRGSLVSEDEQDIRLKYLDPNQKAPTHKASPATPPRGGYGGTVKPKWIRKTIMAEPSNGWTVSDIYHALYQTIREGKPFPVKPEEALDVLRVILEVKKQNPAYPVTADVFEKAAPASSRSPRSTRKH